MTDDVVSDKKETIRGDGPVKTTLVLSSAVL